MYDAVAFNSVGGMMTGSLMSATPPWWFRGSAHRDGEDVVAYGDEAAWYDPSEDRHVGVRLAQVRDPDDVIEFVHRYGLLTSFQCDETREFRMRVDEGGLIERGLTIGSSSSGVSLSVSAPGGHFREPIRSVLDEAQRLHWILSSTLDVRKALAGDSAAAERLSRSAEAVVEANPPVIEVEPTDESRRLGELVSATFAEQAQRNIANPVPYVSQVIAKTVSARLSRMHAYLRADPDREGRFELRLEATTLLDYCYVTVAEALAREPIASCPECARIFVIEDKRQKFCRPACAARARFRRFDNKRKASAETRDSDAETRSRRGEHQTARGRKMGSPSRHRSRNRRET
jgi:hypothetical protein